MNDAEREALLAALMDDGMTEFAALREVERCAADLATMTADTRVKPVACISGTAAQVREQVKQAKGRHGA
jgi:hypothetical protein